MFIDRLLENKTRLRIYNQSSEPWLEWCTKPEIIYKLLTIAVKFDISNCDEYFNTKKKGLNFFYDLPNVKPVFDVCWYEYPHYLPEIKTIGILTFCEDDKTLKNKESCISINFIELNNGINAQGCIFEWYYQEHQLTDVWVYKPNGEQELDINKGLDMIAISGLCTSLLANCFMHCKNVTIQSKELPVKLQKAREHRGKLPLFTFKTLEIKPMVKILKKEGQSETLGLQRALHICRGHFKDFQEGPGLGKNHAHGLYWWDSQVRGNREIGAVIKDYKVSPAYGTEIRES
jgi:hypothetical protein